MTSEEPLMTILLFGRPVSAYGRTNRKSLSASPSVNSNRIHKSTL
jgi:hypothetical protein